LPLRAAREDHHLDHDGLILFLIAGLIEEDSGLVAVWIDARRVRLAATYNRFVEFIVSRERWERRARTTYPT
jgi:hypothetical protein